MVAVRTVEMVSAAPGWAASGKHFHHYDGTDWSLHTTLSSATTYLPDLCMVSLTEGGAVVRLGFEFTGKPSPLVQFDANWISLGSAQGTLITAWQIGTGVDYYAR